MDLWKKYKIDWGVSQNEEKVFNELYLGIKLLQIQFPDFWFIAYKNKNNFYKYIYEIAKQHVEIRGINDKYLIDDNVKELWHVHCTFCLETITADKQILCYCSEDCSDWICSQCFNDFKERFQWKAIENVQDIPPQKDIPIQVMIAKNKPQ